jgi:hypothetical protein
LWWEVRKAGRAIEKREMNHSKSKLKSLWFDYIAKTSYYRHRCSYIGYSGRGLNGSWIVFKAG